MIRCDGSRGVGKLFLFLNYLRRRIRLGPVFMRKRRGGGRWQENRSEYGRQRREGRDD